jgi:nickel-dependent lactate racemase
MISQFFYGTAAPIAFQQSPDSLLADCTQPHGEPLADTAAAAAAAVANPLEFPPLDRATVPGDVVVLALEDDLPQAAELVAGIVAQLQVAGITPDRISIAQIRSAVERNDADPRALLPAEIREQIGRVVHDPTVREELAFLAPNRQGEAVYLNRTLCDADLVIPVGCIRRGYWSSRSSAFSGLFPAFSDVAAQKLMRQQMRLAEEERKTSTRLLQDEVGWLLGSLMTVHVVPGVNDSVLHVVCGEVQATMKRGHKLYKQAWTQTVPATADLVIAAISGDAAQQTWENIARALAAARQVASGSGCIALCTELNALPGEAVRGLAEVSDPSEARELLAGCNLADAAIAEEVALTLEQGSLFLLSGLQSEFVESLGLVPLADETQVQRLADRFNSTLLLGHAQFALPRLAELEEV